MATALMLSLATGLAAQAAIAEIAGVSVDIRWPNDLMVDEKKCGGILAETAVAPEGTLRYAVIGVGINLNHAEFPEEIARVATSLLIEGETVISREAMLIALLQRLDAEIRLLIRDWSGAGDARDLLRRFAEASSWVRGKRVRVDEGGGYTGVTAGLDARGFLRVDGDDGVMRTVLSGGVRGI
jgi:BirA family biotin operon repressor/biotin-[acetyl-CoA-carboxylase] ligase